MIFETKSNVMKILVFFSGFALAVLMILTVSFKSVKKADSFVELISEDYPIETINIESEEMALVNYSYFKELVLEIENYRPARLISLDTFLVKARNPNTVILDTRSKEMYNL